MASNGRESKRSGKSKSTITAVEFLSAISQAPNGTQTSESAVTTTCQQLTSLAVDSPAKTLAMPASEQESTANAAVFGPNMRESFGSYDRVTSSWRTSQLCLDGEWSVFSETWPRAGMTRNGKAYELPTLALRTEESEFGLWPTPRASEFDGRGGANRTPGTGGATLSQSVRLWPTPRASDYKGCGPVGSKSYQHMMQREYLCAVVMEKFATPQSRDFRTGQSSRWENSARSRNLNDQIGGQLNPRWVEWLMGYPLGWTDCEDLETPSCRKSRNGLEGKS